MSKNLRDLYKKKGKKLSDEENSSKTQSKTKLENFIANQSHFHSKRNEMTIKILALKRGHKIDSTSTNKLSTTTGEIEISILNFGINYQRIFSQQIDNIEMFWKDFVSTTNIDLELKEFLKLLLKMKNLGLIFQYENEHLLFEPLTKSQDINKILALVDSSGSIPISKIHSELSFWSLEKVDNIINVLEQEGIAIKDDLNLWFPQLTK